MSIRDIIEKWHLISTNYARHGYSAVVHGRDFEEMRDDFASALEELALMEAERDALLAEHEAWTAWRTGKPLTSRKDWNRLTNAHDNAERVIRG